MIGEFIAVIVAGICAIFTGIDTYNDIRETVRDAIKKIWPW